MFYFQYAVYYLFSALSESITLQEYSIIRSYKQSDYVASIQEVSSFFIPTVSQYFFPIFKSD